MKPTQTLPETYLRCYTLDSRQHKAAQVLLIFLALAGFLLCWQVIKLVSPASINSLKLGKDHLFTFFAAVIIMIVLHECIHGLTLWISTRKFPPFGISLTGSVYVNAAGWFLPRLHMLIMLLSPFLLLSMIGIIFLSFSSGEFFRTTLWIVILNAAGSINDLAVAGWLFFQPDTALIENTGQALTIYRQGEEQSARLGAKEKIREFMERYVAKIP
jgi:hypothetical protein